MKKAESKNQIRVFEDSYNGFIQKTRERGTVDIDDILVLITMLQKYECDCHCAIVGQNGVGKTYLMLMIMKKYLGNKWKNNLMLARNTTNDIVNFILENEGTMLGIDEMNTVLYYKNFMSMEQKHLITMLELARSKRLAFIGCIRDPRKLTYNYRTGKLSLCIWVIDRYDRPKNGFIAYAAVFAGSPVLEIEDKFGFSLLDEEFDITTFNDVRAVFESLPSFIGYLPIKDACSVLTKKDLDDYREFKKTAMAYAHLNHCLSLFQRKKMTPEELSLQLRELAKVLPEDEIDQYYPKRAANMKKLSEWSDG